MNENLYQRKVKERLRKIFPDCIILKNNANDIQGIPDLTLLYNGRWAWIEVKRSGKEFNRPYQDVNQQYYLNKARELGGYSTYIYPENEEEVYNELKEFFE